MTPRTAKESAIHILAELCAGRLGAMGGYDCVYEDAQGLHCGVGCLFTPDQHKWIKDRGLSNVSVSALEEEIGEDNMAFVSGMCMGQLTTLQGLHDGWAQANHYESDRRRARLKRFLEKIIAAE